MASTPAKEQKLFINEVQRHQARYRKLIQFTHSSTKAAGAMLLAAVVALIVVPVFSLARGMHWSMFFVIAAAAFAVWYLGWSPIYILIAAAAIGISWTLLITKKAKK